MIINNTSIPGIWIYSDTDLYEEGDFVGYGKTLYVCSPKSGQSYVSGENPAQSDNFTIYLGDMMASVQDFLDFVDQGGGQDKYISLRLLPAILNQYMLGLTGKGIIGDSIELDDSGKFVVTINSQTQPSYTNPKTVLADIMLDPDINNAVFRISRKLPEVETWLLLSDSLASKSKDIDKSSCILRQYTYLGQSGQKTRIQEIIDHVDGEIYFRSATLGQSQSSILDSGFKSVNVNAVSLRDKSNKLFSLYASKIKALEALATQLKGNFRYRPVLLPTTKSSSVTLQNQDSSRSGYLRASRISDIGNITVGVLTPSEVSGSERDIWQTTEFTFDPSSSITKYFLTRSLWAKVSLNYYPDSTTQARIQITLGNDTSEPVTSVIGWVNYQEFYVD